jgi:BirA family biotin operon repressor/biotin-[acetyl-CoA-carboxylase] ligase
VPAKTSVDKFQEGLQTKRFGRTVLFSTSVPSTNDWAKKLAAMSAAEGTVVIAETQTAGHGRLNREWISPRGGLYFSVIVRPELDATDVAKLVFVASLAVTDALGEEYGLNAQTKWPNDVLVDGKKICGILAEMNTTDQKVNYAVIGIGINANLDVKRVFPSRLKPVTTSIENEVGSKVKLEDLFRDVISRLEKTYNSFERKGFATILAEWKRHTSFLGQEVEVTDLHEKMIGLASDVDEEGSLILKLENGKTCRVRVGDVSLRVS